jgi:hypothetical protein
MRSGEEGVSITQMRKLPVNFEAMVAKQSDVTRRLGLRPRFPGIRLPRFCGKVGDKCGASQRAWRAFSFDGIAGYSDCVRFGFHCSLEALLSTHQIYAQYFRSQCRSTLVARLGLFSGRQGSCHGKFTTSQFSAFSPANLRTEN